MSLLSFLLMLALNFLAHGVDKTVLKNRIVSAFHDRELVEVGVSPSDLRRGINQFNDCLILQSTLLTHGNRFIDSVSPLVIEDIFACSRLKALALEGDAGRVYDYNRYLWGARSLTALALQFVSLRALRLMVEVAVYAVFLVAFLGGIFYAGRHQIEASSSARLFGYSVAILSGTFLTFYALHYYAPNIGHGFSELVIALFLLSSLIGAHRQRRRAFVIMVSLLGAWTAYFELLTGPFVIGFLLTGILSILQIGNDSKQSTTRRACLDVGGYCLGFFTIMLLQQLSASVATGTNTFKPFWIHLALRMQLHNFLGTPVPELWQTESNMASYSAVDVFLSVWTALPNLTFGSRMLSYAFVVLALIMFSLGTYLAFVSRSVSHRAQTAAIGLLMFIVPAWYLVFSNHTVIHASFAMVRLVAVPWAMSAIICGVGFVAFRESRRNSSTVS